MQQIFFTPAFASSDLFVFIVGVSQRRHNERDARGEAVHLQNDRKQRPWDEGSAHGQRNGETQAVLTLLCVYCIGISSLYRAKP